MTFSVEVSADRAVLREPGRQEAEVYFFGALPNRYAKPGSDGVWHNIFAAYGSPEEARLRISEGFRGAKLSPFACRLKNSGYVFKGQAYRVDKHVLNGHAIHGLLYDAEFALHGSGADDCGAWVELVYEYRAAEAGYPFAFRMKVRYGLNAGGLTVQTTVNNTGETGLPLADGWHPYFRLGVPADECRLHINSSRMLEFDADLVPTGRILSDTRFADAGRPAGLRDIALDNSFLLAADGLACVLEGGGWRLRISAVENYPVLQIYIPPERDCIAVENLSGAPDCFNNGIGLVELAAGASRRFTALYAFEAV